MQCQTRAQVSMSPLLAVVKKVPHKEEFWKQQEAAQISGQHYSYHYSYIRQHRDGSGVWSHSSQGCWPQARPFSRFCIVGLRWWPFQSSWPSGWKFDKTFLAMGPGWQHDPDKVLCNIPCTNDTKILCNIPCTKDVWLLRVNILTKIYIQINKINKK